MAGVFKSLDKSDVRITPFRTHKLWAETLESTVEIQGYLYSPSSMRFISYPFQNRYDGYDDYARIYCVDGSNVILSIAPQTGAHVKGAVLGASSTSNSNIEPTVNYLTGLRRLQEDPGSARLIVYVEQYDSLTNPTTIDITSGDIDATKIGTVSIAALSGPPSSPTQEFVNRIDYFPGEEGRIFISTTWRLLATHLGSNGDFVGGIYEIENGAANGAYQQAAFLGSIARPDRMVVVYYDRANQLLRVEGSLNITGGTQTIMPNPGSNGITLTGWNDDLRIKHIVHDTQNGDVMFTLKNYQSMYDNSPIYGSNLLTLQDQVFNGNFVALLSDRTHIKGFTTNTPGRFYAVTSDGFLFKELAFRSTFEYTDILDLRQYVGAGNEVVDAVITADNDDLYPSITPRTITLIVKPQGLTHQPGPHQLVTINLDTDEVYDPIHLGSVVEGYYYGGQNYGVNPLGGSNFVTNGNSLLAVGGLGMLTTQTLQSGNLTPVYLHTFNLNV